MKKRNVQKACEYATSYVIRGLRHILCHFINMYSITKSREKTVLIFIT